MKKRLLALLLALTLTVSLAACGGGEQNDADDSTSAEDTLPKDAEQEEADSLPGTDKEGSETDGDMTVVDIEDVEEEQAKEPQIGQQPANPNEKPQTGSGSADTNKTPESKPVEKPSVEQKPSGGQNTAEQKPAEEQKPESSSSVDLTAFRDSVTSSGSWPAMAAVEGEVLDSYYPGLSDVATNQCLVSYSVISASVGEIALVEVKNASDVQTVKDIFQARIDYQVGDDENPGGAWYPGSIEGWKTGSRIVSNGNYVMLVALSEGADDVVASFNALFA